MDVMDVTEELISLAANRFKCNQQHLQPDDDFFEKLSIDSLGAVNLLTQIEEHFAIEIPDYEMKGVNTFRQLAERIKARI